MITEFALPTAPGSFALLISPSIEHKEGEAIAVHLVGWSIETDSCGRRIVEPILASNEFSDDQSVFGFVVDRVLLDPHGVTVARLSGDRAEVGREILGLASRELGVIPWAGNLACIW